MTYYIEKGRGGLSKIDERLEAFRDSETKHIMLTPEDARNILLNTLLGQYRRRVSESVPPLNQPSPKIEALVQIVEMRSSEDRFDFTDGLKSIEEEQRKKRVEREEKRKISSIITPPEPPQAEI